MEMNLSKTNLGTQEPNNGQPPLIPKSPKVGWKIPGPQV